MTEAKTEEKTDDKAKPSAFSRYRFQVLLGLTIALAVGYGIYWALLVRGTVWTDDARIENMLVPCSSRVGGRVVDLAVREGDTVQAGDLLARIDDMPYRSVRDQAAAGVKAAEASLASARLALRGSRLSHEKEIAIAQAEIRGASAKEQLSRKQRDRFQHLSGVAPDYEVDQARAMWDGTDAALQISKDKLALLTHVESADGDSLAPRELQIKALENKVAMAQAQLDLARAQLVLAESNLAEVEVKSPVAGQVSRRHVELGQVVAPGQKLMSVSVMTSPWVEANFEEGDLAEIRPGDRVKIEVDAFSDHPLQGHVVSVLGATLSEFALIPAGSSSGNFIKVTQRAPVIIAIDDPDPPALFPGLNVEVRVILHSAPPATKASAPEAKAAPPEAPAKTPAPAPAEAPDQAPAEAPEAK